jgi:hypothetical protein
MKYAVTATAAATGTIGHPDIVFCERTSVGFGQIVHTRIFQSCLTFNKKIGPVPGSH